MAANPQVAQGTLNRVRGSVVVPDFPELNVTAAFLGRAGISMGRDGDATQQIGTLTGTVNSPEAYQMVTVTVNLLKTQALPAQYEARIGALSVIGDITVITDAITLPNYTVVNASIQNVRELSFSGEDAGYVVTIRGYIIINNDLWNLV